MRARLAWLLQLLAAAALAVTAYLHADLYVHSYRVIPKVGVAFLLQASAGFAIAALLPLCRLLLMRIAAAALSAATLGGFIMSRTVGVLGFTEHGWEPAPQAALSVVAEIGTLLLLVVAIGLADGPRLLGLLGALSRRPRIGELDSAA